MSSDRQSSSEKKQNQRQINSTNDGNYTEKSTELTAEWNVHAQLIISRPNSNIITGGTNYNNDDGLNSSGNCKFNRNSSDNFHNNPVKVIYKWSSDDIKPHITTTTEKATTTTTTTSTDEGIGKCDDEKKQNTPIRTEYRSGGGDTKNKSSEKINNGNNAHSNLGGSGKAPSDSGFSSNFYNYGVNSNKWNVCGGTRCRSTCSIVLSAVADFLPACNDLHGEIDPLTYNTATSYTVSPEKTGDDVNVSQNFGSMKILALRDAFSQTSDNEINITEESYRCYPQFQQTTTSSSGLGYITNEENDEKKRKHDYRRDITSTESIKQQQQQYSLLPADQTEEGISKSPFFMTGPLGKAQQYQQPYKSPSQSSILQSHLSSARPTVIQKDNDSLFKKTPRTVHIDVYCTGSDAEEDENDRDGDESSSPSSENPIEVESNSTLQTVLNIEQMLLRHHRAGKHEMPRKLKIQKHQQQPVEQLMLQQQQQHQVSKCLPTSTDVTNVTSDLGHEITKSNTADEIFESKQILFKKHIGDQKNSKLNLRNRANVRKNLSDDCLSSSYPNSSRSTMRDLTCSSISSVVAASNLYEDFESSWKDTDAAEGGNATSLGKSDSFEYDNSIDRLRIKRMEKLWSRPGEQCIEHEECKSGSSTNRLLSPDKYYVQNFLQNIRSPYITMTQQQYNQLTPSDYDSHSFETSQYSEYPSIILEKDEQLLESDTRSSIEIAGPMTEQRQETIMTMKPQQTIIVPDITTDNILRNENNENNRNYLRYSSSEPRSPDRTPSKTLFHAEYNKSGSEASTMQTNLSGYTSEYLAKARKFGSVITTLRKPGHHIGPAKNPECQCEHCRQWVAERSEGIRNRAFSMSDAFNFKQNFWLRKSKNIE